MKEKLNYESIKIVIRRSEYFPERSEYIRDLRIMRFMEFKMRSRYNSGRLSRYVPTENEKEVIRRNLDEIFRSYRSDFDNSLEFTMIKSLYDELCAGSYVEFNKRAWISCIDRIKRIWMKKFPEYIMEKM